MHSSIVSKIDKAHRYAQEPERIQINSIGATFRGGHDDYVVTLKDNDWHCTCNTFESHAIGKSCSHIMAMQQLLGTMLCEPARYWTTEPVLAVGD